MGSNIKRFVDRSESIREHVAETRYSSPRKWCLSLVGLSRVPTSTHLIITQDAKILMRAYRDFIDIRNTKLGGCLDNLVQGKE